MLNHPGIEVLYFFSRPWRFTQKFETGFDTRVTVKAIDGYYVAPMLPIQNGQPALLQYFLRFSHEAGHLDVLPFLKVDM